LTQRRGDENALRDPRDGAAKLLRQRLIVRDFDRQVVEVQLHVAVLNGFTAPGIPATYAVGQVSPGKRKPGTSADLCNRAAAHQNGAAIRSGEYRP
jgi:hypothetical protein